MNAISVQQSAGSDDAVKWQFYKSGPLFVAVPSDVRTAEVEAPSESSIESLEALQHPAHILSFLQSIPLDNSIRGIYLFESLTRTPARPGHPHLTSDSIDDVIYIDVSAEQKLELIFHELAHILLDTAHDTEYFFALARSLEGDMSETPEYAVANTHENWAHYFEQAMLIPNPETFERFCHQCPLRATVMARHLLALWLEFSDAGWVKELRGRLEFINNSIAMIAQLMLITAVYAEADPVARENAVLLLLRYGEDSQLSMLGTVTALNLSNQPLSADEISRTKALVSLEHLDLSGTAATDHTVCQLHPLSKLKKLSLSRTQTTNLALSGCLEFPLEELDLRQTNVNDAAVTYFRQMPQLRVLRLSSNALSPVALKEIETALPECRLELA